MNFDLNLYKVFYEVCRCKNLSHASERLYISQPAVSKSIKTLENNLGMSLFSRKSKGVSLTKEGEILFTHVENALNELSLGEDKLNKIKNRELGTINLGVSSILGKNYLLPKLEDFLTHYENFKVNIINKHTEDEIELIKKEMLEIAICCTPISDSLIDFIPLEMVDDIFVCTKAYLENNSLYTEEEIFSKGSFMLLEEGNLTRKYIDDFLSSLGVSISLSIEASNMDFLIECGKMGLGITSVLKSFVKKELENGELIEVPIHSKIPQRSIGVCYKKGINLSIPSRTLIDFLKNN
ncbi:MAG: LysR family transcriptional regulator [Clostridium sp.]